MVNTMAVVQKECKNCGREYRVESDYLKQTSRWRVCDSGHLWFNCSCDSTVMVPKGKFEWYTPDQVLSEEACGVFNRLPNLGTLPHLPTSIMELQAALADSNSSNKLLVEKLRKNAFVATEVLKSANNMRAGRAAEIKSLEHALSFVGRSLVSELALLASLKSIRFRNRVYTQKKFWGEALSIAEIAEFVARRYAPDISSDLAYLAGCLCNIGKVVSALCQPDQLDEVYSLIRRNKDVVGWEAAEAELGVFRHVILGEIAGAFWGLPKEIIEVTVEHHKEPEMARESPFSLSEVVGFANQLRHLVNDASERSDQRLVGLFCEKLSLGQEALDDLIVSLREGALA